jgi:hypothetical protein
VGEFAIEVAFGHSASQRSSGAGSASRDRRSNFFSVPESSKRSGPEATMNVQVPGEVLIEFLRVGNAVKVSAIHVDTDTEVCIVGPQTAGRDELTRLVINKLYYVLGRRKAPLIGSKGSAASQA